jgi:hypothetical protein
VSTLTNKLNGIVSVLYICSLFWEFCIIKNIKWAYFLMVFRGVVFSGVVGTIENTLAPKISELVLCIATF